MHKIEMCVNVMSAVHLCISTKNVPQKN